MGPTLHCQQEAGRRSFGDPRSQLGEERGENQVFGAHKEVVVGDVRSIVPITMIGGDCEERDMNGCGTLFNRKQSTKDTGTCSPKQTLPERVPTPGTIEDH